MKNREVVNVSLPVYKDSLAQFYLLLSFSKAGFKNVPVKQFVDCIHFDTSKLQEINVNSSDHSEVQESILRFCRFLIDSQFIGNNEEDKQHYRIIGHDTLEDFMGSPFGKWLHNFFLLLRYGQKLKHFSNSIELNSLLAMPSDLTPLLMDVFRNNMFTSTARSFFSFNEETNHIHLGPDQKSLDNQSAEEQILYKFIPAANFIIFISNQHPGKQKEMERLDNVINLLVNALQYFFPSDQFKHKRLILTGWICAGLGLIDREEEYNKAKKYRKYLADSVKKRRDTGKHPVDRSLLKFNY